MAAVDPADAPQIPVGLATKLGALGTMVLGVSALVAAVMGGDHSAETIGALASAAIVLIATIAGRFAQAYAIYRDAPSPVGALPVAGELLTAEPSGTTYAGPGKPKP